MPKIKEPLKKIGKFIKSKVGNPGPLPESFIKEYNQRQTEQGEHPLDVTKRVLKKRQTSDGYMRR